MKTESKIISAKELVMTIVVHGIGLVLIFMILLKVVPPFRSMFGVGNSALPAMTSILFFISQSAEHYWFLWIAFIVLLLTTETLFFKKQPRNLTINMNYIFFLMLVCLGILGIIALFFPLVYHRPIESMNPDGSLILY